MLSLRFNGKMGCLALLLVLVRLSQSICQATDSPVPGSGSVGVGSMSGSSGCVTCGAGGVNGAESFAGIWLKVATGAALDGSPAGDFYLNGSDPSPSLSTPVPLEYSAETESADGVEVVRDSSGALLQVVAPQSFSSINAVSAYAYQISIYNPVAKGAWNGTNYAIVNGSANLIGTWTIENPDASPVVYNRLRITESLSGQASRVWTYTYTAATRVWVLSLPGGLGEERVSQATDASTGYRVERIQWCETDGTVRQERASWSTSFDWGMGVVAETFGSGGALRTNLFSYFTNASFAQGVAGKPLRTARYADGTWKVIESYDSSGRPLVVYEGAGTNGVVNGVFNTNTVSCWVTANSYTPVTGYGDDGSYRPERPRRITRSYQGTPVSRTYYVETPNEGRVIQCISPSGQPSDSGNLITITKYYSSGTWQGQVQSVDNPDGTMTLYSYSENAGQKTTTRTSGEPNSTKTAILNGTQTTTVETSLGQNVSETVRYVSGGSVGIVLATDTWSNFDTYGRPQRVTHLDGSFEDTVYGCCGVTSSTDRDGVATQYLSDVLKRPTGFTRLGVTTTYVLDAVGRRVRTYRTGTDSSQVAMGGTLYSTSGEILASTNAFGGVTTVTESFTANGQRVRTTIAPDEGTAIETYAADGSREKLMGTAANPHRLVTFVENTTDAETGSHTWLCRKEIKLDSNGNDTVEWVKTYEDAFGRSVKTVYPDGGYSLTIYNSLGQVTRTIDPDKVTTLYQYNGQGELEYTALDLNQNGVIDLAGTDRVTQTVRDVVNLSGVDVRRTRTYQFAAGGSSTPLLIGEARFSVNGLQSWNIGFGLTNFSQLTINSGTGVRTTTLTHPDNSTTVSVYSLGRLQTVTRNDSTGSQIGRVNYAYDAHSRLWTMTDIRNGATTYTYTMGDAVLSSKTPVPGTGAPAQTTTRTYDTSGRVTQVTQADGTTVMSEYFATGAIKRTYGSRTYPVEYSYDAQSRMKTMKTWRNFVSNTGSAVTTWNYDSNRGWLLSKDYADASTGVAGTTGPDYTYTLGGRLKTRTWARNHSGGSRIVTTYKYGFDDSTTGNQHADLTEVSYNDAVTAAVGYGYDRRGRQTSVVQGGSSTIRTFDDAGNLLAESMTGGTLNGLSVNSTFDAFLRRNTINFKSGSTVLGSSTSTYDNASRLQSVTDGTYSATYAYLANSPLWETLTFKNSGTTRLTTKRQFDRLNRLQSIVSTPSLANQPVAAYSYTYNDANQRVQVSLGDGSSWQYRYDALGQVISGKHYWDDGTPVPGQQYEYGFDDIGNRQTTGTQYGGDANGQNLRSVSYTPNALNQYTSRTVPGGLDILGLASASSSVTINGVAADYRRGEYFQKSLSVANGSSAVWQGVSIGVGSTTVSGNLFVPQSPESMSYDLDGNLTQDGRWMYTWDGENRLIAMESLTTAPSGSKRKLAFEYDAQGRRICKKVYVWNGTAYPGSPNTTLKFLHDGWNLVGELDGSNVVLRSYQWGTDLSGNRTGAGGVGGLLWVNNAQSGLPTGVQFAAYDGNGNVAGLFAASDGSSTARYEYGPFGEPLRLTGTLAKANPVRWSTKVTDDEGGLVYYGYRYYNPNTGRWVSRDPIGEKGGVSLYGYVNNRSTSRLDYLGLSSGPPAPYVPGPTWTDHLDPDFGGGDDYIDNKNWFDKNYPGWISYIKMWFTLRIHEQINAVCSKSKTTIDGGVSKDVDPMYQNDDSGGRTWDDSANETLYGDAAQSEWSADKVLGGFSFRLEGGTVSYKVDPETCCSRYTYHATFIITDGLGFQPGDLGHTIVLGTVFPNRSTIRGRWDLDGSGKCCPK
jgi:RHS repeat-associated protein